MKKYVINPTVLSNGRAQLNICELRDRTTYWVYYLDSAYPPNTRFAGVGEQLYYGADLPEALRIIRIVFGPKVELPKNLLDREKEWRVLRGKRYSTESDRRTCAI